ncbi:hypothetical protein F5Y02DRAFT_376018 [Annulohypoxylon stygium]|nr:hypothetical protein F5Y02DRAFT_376018 [Annulohypoxylon stygium]
MGNTHESDFPKVMSTLKELTIRPKPSGLAGPCRILDLPPELVLHILSFLEPPQIILFSLTCKSAYSLLNGSAFGKYCLSYVKKELRDCSRQPFGKESALDMRYDFLRLLADDRLNRFVCLHCAKLHPNLTGESRNAHHNSAIIRDRLSARPRGVMSFGPIWPNYAITFDEACAAAKKGSPEKLAISTDWKLARLWSSCYNPDMIHGYIKLDTEAVVVDGSLFFHKVQRLLLRPEKVMPFCRTSKSYLMEEVFKSCNHSGQFRYAFQPSLSAFAWDRLDKLSVHRTIQEFIRMAHWKRMVDDPPKLDGWDLDRINLEPHMYAGCCQCVTDNTITIHSHGRAGVEIIADTYQNFGDLADPQNHNWESCWFNQLNRVYRSILIRRLDYPLVDLAIFPTPPGRSAIKHPSAPSVDDMWELHEHDRAASREARKP